MNNFDLHTPTRILFGKGAIEKLAWMSLNLAASSRTRLTKL